MIFGDLDFIATERYYFKPNKFHISFYIQELRDENFKFKKRVWNDCVKSEEIFSTVR